MRLDRANRDCLQGLTESLGAVISVVTAFRRCEQSDENLRDWLMGEAVPVSLPHSRYDDRTQLRFAVIETTLRDKLLLGVVVMFFAIGVALMTIWNRELSSPRDWLLLATLVLAVIIGGLLSAVIPRSNHYLIAEDGLEYPRWGGLRRGRIPLSDVEAFRREGRDPESSTLILFAGGRRVLVVPEEFLASPDEFREVLRSSGVAELRPDSGAEGAARVGKAGDVFPNGMPWGSIGGRFPRGRCPPRHRRQNRAADAQDGRTATGGRSSCRRDPSDGRGVQAARRPAALRLSIEKAQRHGF